MMKVSFKKAASESKINAIYEDSYIPFSLLIGLEPYSNHPETIYTRNLHGENFLEFRFDKNSHILYEISLVAVQNDTIHKENTFQLPVKNEGFYNCFIEPEHSQLETSHPLIIYRSENSIRLNWDIGNEDAHEYFPLSENCAIGINLSSHLTSIVLTKLSATDVSDILGF